MEGRPLKRPETAALYSGLRSLRVEHSLRRGLAPGTAAQILPRRPRGFKRLSGRLALEGSGVFQQEVSSGDSTGRNRGGFEATLGCSGLFNENQHGHRLCSHPAPVVWEMDLVLRQSLLRDISVEYLGLLALANWSKWEGSSPLLKMG